MKPAISSSQPATSSVQPNALTTVQIGEEGKKQGQTSHQQDQSRHKILTKALLLTASTITSKQTSRESEETKKHAKWLNIIILFVCLLACLLACSLAWSVLLTSLSVSTVLYFLLKQAMQLLSTNNQTLRDHEILWRGGMRDPRQQRQYVSDPFSRHIVAQYEITGLAPSVISMPIMYEWMLYASAVNKSDFTALRLKLLSKKWSYRSSYRAAARFACGMHQFYAHYHIVHSQHSSFVIPKNNHTIVASSRLATMKLRRTGYERFLHRLKFSSQQSWRKSLYTTTIF